ncbi:ribose ABC transporter, periplasmic ribose-binding protein [Pseudomonas fluorescens]|uniref:Ribose ABC transporter, periplasmic ribose-binding protein n=1 Tax=Pseudomonas fluorescens TaxID=294 RepID=A0A8B4I7U7_PSEFL|nr:ribose ABC transporter, periplasmic ribose-binding protein [Pseudomonas fluorescens]
MKTPIRFTALALSMLLASGFAAAADIKVGVTMSAFDDTFLTYLREDMDKQAKSYPKGDGVQLQFEDARADVVKQLSQVENFISQKVDAIIVNPVDTASTKNIISAATKAGIPLVFVNRRPDQKDLPQGCRCGDVR